jgi:hypothetical protein
MRAAVILGAMALAAAVPEALAQQAAGAAPAGSSPLARFMGAVRDSINLPPAAEVEPVATRKKRTRRYRRTVPSRAQFRSRATQRRRSPRRAQQVPWPLPVAASRRAAQGSNVTVLRTSVVRRPIVRTILINNELLPLPAAEFVGDPVKLHVPSVGDVEIPEDRYPQVFKLLVSGNPADQAEALRTLREIRDATDALRDWARSKGRLRNP